MIIRCPECSFERDIPLEAIPPAAVMATCPRCGARFQFRRLEKSNNEGEKPASAAAPRPEAAASASPGVEEQPAAPASSLGDSLPPGAEIPAKARPVPHVSPNQPGEGRVPPHKGEDTEERLNLLSKKTPPEACAVPWERADKYHLLSGLYQTILRALFQPARFFSSLPSCLGSLARPAAFYLLLGTFQALVKLFWMKKALTPVMADPAVQSMVGSVSASLWTALLLTPPLLFLQLYFYAAMFFFMLRLVQPDKANFCAILRVIAYSSAPLVFSIVPLVGPIVAMVWFAVSCVAGCRFALGISWAKLALALLPLYIIAFAVSVMLARQLAAML